MRTRSTFCRFAFTVFTVLALLFAGVAAFLPIDSCEHDACCDDCAVQCSCQSPLAQELSANFTIPDLRLLRGASHDGARLGPGTSDPPFTPPRV